MLNNVIAQTSKAV